SPRANRGESDRFLGPPGAPQPEGAGGARSEERQAEPPALALARLRAKGPQHHAVAGRYLAAARQKLPQPLLPLRVHRPRPPLHVLLQGPQALELVRVARECLLRVAPRLALA